MLLSYACANYIILYQQWKCESSKTLCPRPANLDGFHQSTVQNDGEDENSGDVIPIRLLGGGEHFNDVAGGRREATRTVQRHIIGSTTDCPRTVMLDHVISRGIHCPRPFES